MPNSSEYLIPTKNKAAILMLVLSAFFITNAVIAEFLGVKIFALETTLGFQPLNWNLFGQEGTLNFTVGNLLWPFVFILTDIINEYFGIKGVRRLSFLAVIMISYAFIMVYLAIQMEPAGFWTGSMANKGVPDMQAAYASIFGQGLWIIVGSIIAFLIGQLVDVTVFHRIKNVTGEKKIWLRATGSTAVSQLIDSVVVLYIAFVIGPQHWSIGLWLAVATVNYCYKMVAAVLLTPVLYWIHYRIDDFLGEDLSKHLREEAMRNT